MAYEPKCANSLNATKQDSQNHLPIMKDQGKKLTMNLESFSLLNEYEMTQESRVQLASD